MAQALELNPLKRRWSIPKFFFQILWKKCGPDLWLFLDFDRYTRKTAFCGKDFLHEVQESFPFKIQAILTDNGSEFKAEFDEECKKLSIPHYWTNPNSPDQNAYVESSHSIDQKEFYEVFYIAPSLSGFNIALKEWENLYNNIRPHGSLKFLAPNQFLRYYFEKQKVLPML